MKKIVKFISVALCLSLLVMFGASCSSYGDSVLTLADKSVSVNTYELLLTRMKGTLYSYGYDVGNEKFWKTIISSDGATYDDYFTASILEQASRYVIAEYLFDRKGLVLTKDRVEIVDKLMDKYVSLAGSKNALNSKLKEYGANYDVLRELLLLETKIDMLKDDLFGENGEKIDASIKEKYLEDNYVAFGQIFIATYDYIIDTDDFGDQVYYVDEKHTAIAYDKVNGKTKLDEFGKEVKDVLGNPAYFNEEGKIAYDKVNGVLGYALDDEGDKKIKNKTTDEIKAIEKKVQEYLNACNGDMDAFLEYAELYGEGEGDGETMYLFSSTDYFAAMGDSLAYLDDIAEKIEKLGDAEVGYVRSDFGFHLVCKYDYEKGAYDNKKYESEFADFYPNLIAQLFDEECKKYESEVIVNEDVVESAPTISQVKVNILY